MKRNSNINTGCTPLAGGAQRARGHVPVGGGLVGDVVLFHDVFRLRDGRLGGGASWPAQFVGIPGSPRRSQLVGFCSSSSIFNSNYRHCPTAPDKILPTSPSRVLVWGIFFSSDLLESWRCHHVDSVCCPGLCPCVVAMVTWYVLGP